MKYNWWNINLTNTTQGYNITQTHVVASSTVSAVPPYIMLMVSPLFVLSQYRPFQRIKVFNTHITMMLNNKGMQVLWWSRCVGTSTAAPRHSGCLLSHNNKRFIIFPVAWVHLHFCEQLFHFNLYTHYVAKTGCDSCHICLPITSTIRLTEDTQFWRHHHELPMYVLTILASLRHFFPLYLIELFTTRMFLWDYLISKD